MPLETFAGQDLCEVHNQSHTLIGVSRKTLQSKVAGTFMRDIHPVVEGIEAEAVAEEAAEEEPEEAEEAEEENPAEAEEDSGENPSGVAEADGAGEEGEGTATAEETPTGPIHNAWCDKCGVSASRLLHLKRCSIAFNRASRTSGSWAYAGTAKCVQISTFVTTATPPGSTQSTRCSRWKNQVEATNRRLKALKVRARKRRHRQGRLKPLTAMPVE